MLKKDKIKQVKNRIFARGRTLLLILMDGSLICLSMGLSILLRFEDNWRAYAPKQTPWLGAIVLIYLTILIVGGMYKRMWRYAGVRDLMALFIMMMIGGAVTVGCNLLFTWGMSRAVLLVLCILSTGLIGGARLAWRALKTEVIMRKKSGRAAAAEAPRLMIVGAGSAASYVIRMCENNPEIGVPILMVDADPRKQGLRVGDVQVRGTDADIPALVKQYSIQEIIIAVPSIKGNRLNKLIMKCKETNCRVCISMQIQRAQSGNKQHVFFRELNTADFLSRDEVQLDNTKIKSYLHKQRVLVTGGGGSIGSELCRQIMKYGPEQIIIFDCYENCAYELLNDLWRDFGRNIPVKILIGSIRDKKRLEQVFDTYQPQVVFHAAAHKHVPLMEDSPAEAVKNNVLGTKNLLEAASAHHVARFVQLSTDKAVNPTNVMGATKRITEMMIQSFARHTDMKCMAVRFGNVLGSHGSVIPLFERQIKNGGPVTITHPEITRYFMTIPEAAQLVLQAGSIAESGAIFVLDMGEPVKIRDLAEKLMRFYGYEPGVTMDIVCTGLRPGEKLYEELLTQTEQGAMRKTAHDKIMIAPPMPLDDDVFDEQIRELIKTAEDDGTGLHDMLMRIVPTYREETARGEQAKLSGGQTKENCAGQLGA